MYQIMSNYYGQMSTKATIEAAIETAEAMTCKGLRDQKFSVWCNGTKLYETK